MKRFPIKHSFQNFIVFLMQTTLMTSDSYAFQTYFDSVLAVCMAFVVK